MARCRPVARKGRSQQKSDTSGEVPQTTGLRARLRAVPRGFWWVLAFAALTRIVYLIDYSLHNVYAAQLESDALYYHSWAVQLSQGQGPDLFYHAPLYPYLLAGIYAIFGTSLPLVYVLQSLVGLATLTLVYRITARIASHRAGLYAMALGALYGPLVFYELKVLTDSLAVFFGALTVWWLLRTEDRPSWKALVLPGVSMGLLALTRPNLLLFAPLAVVWLLIRSSRSWRRRWAEVAILCGVAALTILPAAARNYLRGEDTVLISANGGINFYFANSETAKGSFNAPGPEFGSVFDQALKAWTLAEAESGESMSASQVSRFWFGKGLEYIREEPGDWLALELEKLRAFVSSFEYGMPFLYSAERPLTPSLFLMPLPFAIILALAIVGGLWLRRENGGRLLILFFAANLASMLIFFVYARFRLAAFAALLPLAGFALQRLHQSWAAHRRPTGAHGLAAALVVISLVITDEQQTVQRTNAHCELGFAMMQKGDVDSALEQFREAMKHDSRSTKARLGIGWALESSGRFAEAIDAYERAVQQQGGYSLALLNLGRLYADCPDESLRDLDRAREYLQRAVDLEPTWHQAHYYLALTHERRRELTAARRTVNEALRLKPEDPQAQDLKARLSAVSLEGR